MRTIVEPDKELERLVNDETDRLLTEYCSETSADRQDLRDRLRNWTSRNLQKLAPHQLAKPAALRATMRDWPWRAVGEAFRALGDEALDYLESVDLSITAQRILAADYLADGTAPLATREEFRGHLEAFCGFLEEHRAYLIQTGLPPIVSSPWRWLHIQLGRLYDTRQSSFPFCADERASLLGGSSAPDAEPPYRFIRRTDWGTATDYVVSSYEEASYLG